MTRIFQQKSWSSLFVFTLTEQLLNNSEHLTNFHWKFNYEKTNHKSILAKHSQNI